MNSSDKKRIVLTIVSCVGVAGTAVAAHFNTIKAQEILHANHPDDHVGKVQEMKETWKYYIPTMIAGAATITSIVVNHQIGVKEIAALVASGGASFATLAKYKDKVKEVCGLDAFVEVEKRMAHDAEKGIVHAVDPDIYVDGLCDIIEDPEQDGHLLFYDTMTDTWFRASLAHVYNARYHLNRNFQLGGCVTVYDWLCFLGLDGKVKNSMDKWSKYGWGFQYIEGGCYTIDLAVYQSETLNDGETYYIISPVFMAEELTEEDGI